MGYLVLRSNALFCAAASVGKLLFIRPSTSKPKPSVISTSARVMFRGCASSSIVRGFFMFPPGSPSHLITAPPQKKTNGKLERYVVRIDLRVVIVRYRLGFIRRIPNVKNS